MCSRLTRARLNALTEMGKSPDAAGLVSPVIHGRKTTEAGRGEHGADRDSHFDRLDIRSRVSQAKEIRVLPWRNNPERHVPCI